MDILTDLFILSVGGVIGFTTAAIFASRAISEANNKLAEASIAAYMIVNSANELGCLGNEQMQKAIHKLFIAVGDFND